LIRDHETSQSRGFAFVEFSGVSDATEALAGIQALQEFLLDGRRVNVTFARGAAGQGRAPETYGAKQTPCVAVRQASPTASQLDCQPADT